MSTARARVTCFWSTPAASRRCRSSWPTSGPATSASCIPRCRPPATLSMAESTGMSESFATELDLPAPVEEVFRHLTDPAAMTRWLGQPPPPEPAVGGAFEVDINGVPVRGRYLEVDPPRRVVVSWGVAGSTDLPPGTTEVEFTLTPIQTGTHLRLVHRGLPPSQGSIHGTGWNHFLPRLTLAAAGTDPGPDPWSPAY